MRESCWYVCLLVKLVWWCCERDHRDQTNKQTNKQTSSRTNTQGNTALYCTMSPCRNKISCADVPLMLPTTAILLSFTLSLVLQLFISESNHIKLANLFYMFVNPDPSTSCTDVYRSQTTGTNRSQTSVNRSKLDLNRSQTSVNRSQLDLNRSQTHVKRS